MILESGMGKVRTAAAVRRKKATLLEAKILGAGGEVGLQKRLRRKNLRGEHKEASPLWNGRTKMPPGTFPYSILYSP